MIKNLINTFDSMKTFSVYQHKTISPELRVTALLGLPSWTPHQRHTFRELAAHINLSKLEGSLNLHRVTQASFTLLDEEDLPNNDWQELKHRTKLALKKNAAHTKSNYILLNQILYSFKNANIPSIAIKGIPLAQKLYGDAAKRHSKDLDILVPFNHLGAAHKILTELGFTSNDLDSLTTYQRKLYFKVHKDIVYRRPGNSALELHYSVVSYPTGITQLFDKLLNDPNRQLNDQDELLYLCWHGANTLFHRIKWLTDIALYLQRLNATEDLDIAKHIYHRAKELGVSRELQIAWLLTHTLYATKVPQFIREAHTKDWISRLSYRWVIEGLHKVDNLFSSTSNLRRLTMMMLMPTHASTRITAFFYKFHPGLIDIQHFPKLPACLAPFYLLPRRLIRFYRSSLLNR